MSYFQNLADISNALNALASKTGKTINRHFITEAGKMTAQVVSFSETENALHIQNNHDEILVIIDGNVDFKIGDETRQTQKNDLLYIPAGTLHGPLLKEGESFTALSVFAPAFEFNSDNIQWQRDQYDASAK